MWVRPATEPAHFCPITHQQVQTGNQTVHPMDKKGEMNGRLPWQNVPRRDTRWQVALNPGHYPGQHGEEAAGRDRGCAIERERTSALAYHLSRAWLTHVQACRVVARVHAGSLGTQFDEPLFRARLAGCGHDLLEDVPLHRLGRT